MIKSRERACQRAAGRARVLGMRLEAGEHKSARKAYRKTKRVHESAR